LPEPFPPHPQWLRIGSDFVTVEVLARPSSQRPGLLRVEARGLVIAVASPPEKGKANDELMATIADIVGVARAEVSILRGASTRNKVIRIANVEPSMMARRLSGLAVKAK
jgi:uncharacterized protein (TIGR00251 family)